MILHGCRWKYSTFLAGDANFQHCCKNISSEEKDPSLCDEMAYFVRYEPYMARLKEYGSGKQPVRMYGFKLSSLLISRNVAKYLHLSQCGK